MNMPRQKDEVDEMGQTESAPAPPAGIVLTPSQFEKLLERVGGSGGNSLNAEELAKAFNKAQKPENQFPPQVTPYNPMGQRDHPAPMFVARRVYQNNIELDRDTTNWEEIVALNHIASCPGHWTVKKSDGSKVTIEITRKMGADESTLEEINILIPCKDDNRHNHRPLIDYLTDILTQAGKPEAVEEVLRVKREMDAQRAKNRAGIRV
jgi:hypothetical protein